MDNQELKPCPFCGKPGEIEEIEEDCYGVGCGHCDYQPLAGLVGLGWFRTAAEATEFWNRRAPVSQAALQTEGVPFPPLEFPVMTHDKMGPLWDRLGMQLYAMKYSDLVRAATSSAPAVVQMTDEQKLRLRACIETGVAFDIVSRADADAILSASGVKNA